MGKLFNHRINFNIIAILFIALFFRLFIANFGTLQLDHGTFVAWANQLAISGMGDFYNGWSDYFPGYLYILFLLGKLNTVFPNFYRTSYLQDCFEIQERKSWNYCIANLPF